MKFRTSFYKKKKIYSYHIHPLFIFLKKIRKFTFTVNRTHDLKIYNCNIYDINFANNFYKKKEKPLRITNVP